MERKAAPVEWQVNSLKLAGLSWGRAGEKPLLALHGWLDNAASFAKLAPLLDGWHVVAPDLTGHGLSDHRSEDASYQIWDDLPELLGILDSLGWETFDLVGHSRGGIIAGLLASAFPERINRLVMLDAVAPGPVPPEKFPEQLRQALQDKSRLQASENRVAPSLEDAVTSRARYGLSKEAATLIAQRGLRQCPGGVAWTSDPRLRGASAVKLTGRQIKAVLGALHMPTLLMLASNNPNQMPDLGAYAQDRIQDLAVQVIEGGHHFHMENPVQEVARRLASFLSGTDR